MELANLWSQIKACLVTYVIGSIYVIKQFFWVVNKETTRPKHLKLRDSGKNRFPLALITGGSKGIGFELVKLLVREKFRVIFVARKEGDGQRALFHIHTQKEFPPTFTSVDLSDLKQVQNFVDEIKKKYTKLHLLVNNAGLMMTPYTVAPGGLFEVQWATNLVGSVFLTENLMPLVKRAAFEDGLGRVINLSSSAMFSHNLTEAYWKNMPCPPEEYSPHSAYSNSKVALALYTKDLQNRLNEENPVDSQEQQVGVYCLHPGVISTDLYQHLIPPFRIFFGLPVVKWFLRSAEDSAWDLLYLCLAEDHLLTKGAYYENNVVKPMADVDPAVRDAFRIYVRSLIVGC